MTTTRSSVRPLQKHHSAAGFLDALFQSTVGVGGVIVIGSIGLLTWNGKDTCMEFYSLGTCMEFFYMGSGFIVLGYITKKINIYYFPPLESTTNLTPAIKKKKKLILGSTVKTRALQSIRQHKSQKQPHFWKEKSKAIANSITASYSHIFTQLSILATDSQHWLMQSRSILSSTLSWGQSKFFSQKNIDTLPRDNTLPQKKKKKPRKEKLSNPLQLTSTTSILRDICPAAPTSKDSCDSTSPDQKRMQNINLTTVFPSQETEENKSPTAFPPANTTSTPTTDTAPVSVNKPPLLTSPTASSEIITITPPSTKIEVLLSAEPSTTPFISSPIQETTEENKNLIPFLSSSTTSTSTTDTASASVNEPPLPTSLTASSEITAMTPSFAKTEVLLSPESNIRPFISPPIQVAKNGKDEKKKKEEKLVVLQQTTMTGGTKLVESGRGWETSMLLMQENRWLRLQKEVLKQQVNRAEHQANHLAGIATQLSNQLSNLLSFFGYPYYAPYPSVIMIHQPSPIPSPLLLRPEAHERKFNPFPRR